MKSAMKIIKILFTIAALIELIQGHSSAAIFSMCWAILLQLEVNGEK